MEAIKATAFLFMGGIEKSTLHHGEPVSHELRLQFHV
jgi:hypothetical protein